MQRQRQTQVSVIERPASASATASELAPQPIPRSDLIPLRCRSEEFFSFDEEFLYNFLVEFDANAGLFGNFYVAVLHDGLLDSGNKVFPARLIDCMVLEPHEVFR